MVVSDIYTYEKDCTCDICRKPILSGCEYKFNMVMNGQDFWSFKNHLDCNADEYIKQNQRMRDDRHNFNIKAKNCKMNMK